MAQIKIDRERCKACGLCVIYCPQKALVFSDKINKRGIKPVEFKKDAKCTGCGICALVCPDCALGHEAASHNNLACKPKEKN
jgi:2-oxoglutarate ferredoxin oxidoreductase subunit delta